MTDEEYMNLALQLAERGNGFVNPNPMVGAVIVKNGRIIGQGWHERYGAPHAECNALASCKESPKGATLYVTLEPCCHHGKTPPCTEAIIASGISKVIIGSADPNPLVGGKGVKILRQHGIEVVENVLKEKCHRLNKVFFHYIKTGLPYVVMKYAMTMDGKIATRTGESKWISSELARQRVQEDRHRYSAIMVGSGTVLSDDPLLTCRLENGKNPIRIICDTNLRTPFTKRIISTAGNVPTILATCSSDLEKHKKYLIAGCQVMVVPQKDKHIDLKSLLHRLGEEKIDSIYVEGGGTLNWSVLEQGIVNEVHTYIAPKMFGGYVAPSPIGGFGVEMPADAFLLKNKKVIQLGEDTLIESEVVHSVYGNC